MREKLPTYCPVEVGFDPVALEAELGALRPRFEGLPTTKAMLDRRSGWFALGDDALHANVEHVGVAADGERIVVPGRVPSWKGMGLTHVPDRPETRWGGSRVRRDFDGRWEWKDDLDLPCTRDLVNRIGLRRIDNVRVLSLPAGGFGPVHVDWENDDPWESDGLASLTFMLKDGGVPMRLKTADGVLHDVRDKVFFFKDCVPHGVPVTKSDRMLLRVNGAMHRDRLRSLMRAEGGIC